MEQVCDIEGCEKPTITGRAVQEVQPASDGGSFVLIPKARWGHQLCADHLMMKWKKGDPLPKFKNEAKDVTHDLSWVSPRMTEELQGL